jgi:CBS domain containing-hemolysin-like protein
VFYCLLAAVNSAMINSHPAKLKSMQETGVPGSRMAHTIASDATQLILSMRLARGLLRLLTLALAVTLLLPMMQINSGDGMWDILIILLGVGLVMGLLGIVVENAVLNAPERWASRLAVVAFIPAFIFGPITGLMLRMARSISRVDRGEYLPLITEEEIMTMVDAGEEGGVIEEDEKAMIYSIFQLGDTLAREVMVPRIDIQAYDKDTILVDATDGLLKTGYSRAPVYSGTIDNVVGLVYLKDLLSAWRKGRHEEAISSFLRDAYFVPEAKKVDDLLAEMQARHIHMAVVVDEYGGTAGVVTIEDIVEEIVGEIRDEYDFAEEEAYVVLKEGEFLFSGGIDLDDVNQLAESDLPKATSETLGGFIYSELGRVPARGEIVVAGTLRLVVEQVTGRRIRKVWASKIDLASLEGSEGESD